MAKKMISEEIGTLDVNYTSAEDVITNLQKYIDRYGKDKITLELETTAYSDDNYVAIKLKREETDVEENVRMANESRWKLNEDNNERVMYERLKKKFE